MKKDFIEIESKKIPLSDIKSYEVKTEQVQQTWTEKRKRNWFVRILLLLTGSGFNEPIEVVARGNRPIDVLIIRTVKGDEFRFSKIDYVFNIEEKVRELDEYLNSK